ncbi:MAG TPA: hypothetical protein PLH38_02235 [Clostridia bacterium]|nr:hypothetical protein [Clostridia bacterium]
MLFRLAGMRQEKYYNAFITYIPLSQHKGALTAGVFIFVSSADNSDQDYMDCLIRHEYGHVYQSLILGPLYWMLVGLPSFIWAQFFSKYREKQGVSYDALYCEKWANYLGEKETGYRP